MYRPRCETIGPGIVDACVPEGDVSASSSNLQDIAPDMAERGGEEGMKEQNKQASWDQALSSMRISVGLLIENLSF